LFAQIQHSPFHSRDYQSGKPKAEKFKKPKNQQPREQESKAKQDQRFDAATRQFMFTMTKVSPRVHRNVVPFQI
jgi:hypothetical protein